MFKQDLRQFLEKKHYYILALILILAAGLIFFRIDRADIQSDEATYALRSFGYLDTMDAAKAQTTPIQWFGTRPWWSFLSFHDAPPLVFIIQHLFFSLFGSATVVVRLTSALSGLVSVFAIYWIGRELYTKQAGLLSAFLLSIFTYHTWASRFFSLEPLATAFSLLAIWWFLVLMRTQKLSHYIILAIFIAGAFMSKYTTFFLAPLFLFYAFLKDKKLILNKKIFVSIGLVLLLMLPMIIFNLMTFKTRGHFDLQFTVLFGQDLSQDWPGIGRSLGGQSLSNAGIIFSKIFNSYAPTTSLLILGSLIYLIYKNFTSKKYLEHFFLLFWLVLLMIEFMLIGVSMQYLSFFNPLISIILALGVIAFVNYVFKSKKILSHISLVILLLFAGFELFFNFKTNHSFVVNDDSNNFSKILRLNNANFEYFQDYYLDEYGDKINNRVKIDRIEDMLLRPSINLDDKNIYIYDRNLDWFSSLWYFRRWGIYYGEIFLSSSDFSQILQNENAKAFFSNSKASKAIYIWARNSSTFDPVMMAPEHLSWSEGIAKSFEERGATMTEIKNRDNEPAFNIYSLKLK